MTILELLKEQDRIHTAILAAFDGEGWEQVLDHTENKWLAHSGEIQWLKFEDDEYIEYSYDYARKIGEAEGLAMFYIVDNGDKFYAIFSKENEVNDEQFENLIDG
jgi:hypothetical protein